MTTTVGIIAFSGAQSLDVTGPMDVFAEANRFLAPDRHYSCEVIGIEKGGVRFSNGLTFFPSLHYSEVEKSYDLLLCAGGPDLPQKTFNEDFYFWLNKEVKNSRRFGSICNGAFILARAGLLDGRVVTTHWNDAQALKTVCPTASIEADRLYIQDGKLYTSAGVTAGIDFSLNLVSKDHGPETALNVAKRLLVFTQRTGGQSQFSPFLTAHAEPTSPVSMTQQHILKNLREHLSVPTLAGIANMSERHFSRLFHQETKITPAEFVERARVDAARTALESTKKPLKVIAYDCGFRGAQHMRSVFVRRLGVSPQQFRLNFSTSLTANQGHSLG